MYIFIFIFTVHVVGRVNGTVFDEREVKFPLGEGTEHNIPEGLERAIERFKKGEKSSIKLAPKVLSKCVILNINTLHDILWSCLASYVVMSICIYFVHFYGTPNMVSRFIHL